MQLTGFFVEYLIIGSTSLIWIFPLLQATEISLPENSTIVLLLAPVLYVLGMIVDFIGIFLTQKHRRRIKKSAEVEFGDKYGLDAKNLTASDVDILAFSSDVGNATISRKSRSRVARGTLTNMLIGSPICLFVYSDHIDVEGMALALILIILGVAGLWKMWARWQRSTYRFVIRALSSIPKDAKSTGVSQDS